MGLTRRAYEVVTVEDRVTLEIEIAEALASGDPERVQDARQAAEILEHG